MKTMSSAIPAMIFYLLSLPAFSQNDEVIHPSLVRTGTFLGETKPAREMPVVSAADVDRMQARAEQGEFNEEMEKREYPFAATALPRGNDPVVQDAMGFSANNHSPIFTGDGQSSTYVPPDCSGTVGPYHFFQAVNGTYTIYDKQGNILAGPTSLNLLFNGVPGSNYNDGDPIVLYDDQADRWVVSEFSVSGPNDYELVAVSSTSDPTGTWYAYSFDVDDMPDYPKLGVWRDGYYMGTNNNSGKDIYVFERDKMLLGQPAQMVGFNNPWRPTTIDGFMCIPPVNNDGAFAPAGSPGIFITINDDAIGGGSDQLWIYELAVNWTSPASSTFTRSAKLNTAPFDSNFGSDWNNISQAGTTQKVDALPMVIMNIPQYRNFGTYQSIVCCHTVDVDNTNHAGVRWYELRKTTGGWSIRQQGTYAPDSHSRWMGSIMLNGNGEIAVGYSISSSTLNPGIRYAGQSAAAYAAATGTLDVAEDIILAGTYSQTNGNRWGDYSQMSVDPFDDETFWFTAEYIGAGDLRKTRIANFQLGAPVVTANFMAGNTCPELNTTVPFTDESSGGVTGWNWSFSPSTVVFVNNTSATSRNPQVQFTAAGLYTVTLQAGNANGSDTETKTGYIHAGPSGIWTGITSDDWNTASNWQNYNVPFSSSTIQLPSAAPNWPVFTGNLTLGSSCGNIILAANSQLGVNGDLTINPGYSLTVNGNGVLKVKGDWIRYGTFTPGAGTVIFTGADTSTIIAGINPANYVANFIRSTFPSGMTPLTNPAVGPAGDDAVSTVPIGFSFSYLGTNYTTAQISTNGWISLNGSGSASSNDNSILFNATAPNLTLAPWFDNLRDDNVSSVNYKTEGTAPNRVFTMEWYRVRSFASSTAYVRISFQAKFYETTNIIEFCYGTVESGLHSPAESASIGMKDGTGGTGHFKEATTGSILTGVTNLNSQSNWPVSNYRFTPPSNNQEFFNLTIQKTGGTLMNPGATTINGDLTLTP